MLAAGRELDCLIYANIFHPEVSFDYKPQDGCLECMGDTVNCQVPAYSTDIAAAWEVVEKVKRHEWDDLFMRWDEGDKAWWVGRVGCGDNGGDEFNHEVDAPTLPLAICLAALKAVGYEPKEIA